MTRDEIYASGGTAQPFEFNEQVARVFPDMLRRSIPGYTASLDAIASLAPRFVRPGSRCYDLGCSLGAAALAMQHNVTAPGCRVIAVDDAPAMVERCRRRVARQARPDGPPVEVRQADIRATELDDASMAVMNYTLQFLPVGERDGLIRRLAAELAPGGLLVLSEKVISPDETFETLLVELHHEYKRRNAYSDLEISRKRAALENVLVPEPVETHLERLVRCGFRHAGVLLRHLNFVTLLALR